jgi:hypothetical protein
MYLIHGKIGGGGGAGDVLVMSFVRALKLRDSPYNSIFFTVSDNLQ